MNSIALLIAAMLSFPASVDTPFAIEAPSVVAVEWHTFENLEAVVGGLVDVVIDPVQQRGRSRIDVLRRDGKRWIWDYTSAYVGGFRVPIANYDRGVLLRVENSSIYYWSEISSYSRRAVKLRPFRNLIVSGNIDQAVLFLSSEESPRLPERGRNSFSLVPPENGLACGCRNAASVCVPINEGQGQVTINPVGAARILRAQPQANDQFEVLTEGRSLLTPRRVPAAVLLAGPWVALVPPDSDFAWEKATIQRSGADFALERLDGQTLQTLPSFSTVANRSLRGLVINAWVGEFGEPLNDPSAVLAVLEAQNQRIPLVTATPNETGSFLFPSLGAGEYMLKLISSSAASSQIKLSAVPGVTSDVVFPDGPTVAGRLIRASSGEPQDSCAVEVTMLMTLDEAVRSGDLTDKLRTTIAKPDGKFRLVLPSPGKYRLAARWGKARVEQEFEIRQDLSDVDLGEIALRVGPSLHGRLLDCKGEIALIPTPQQAAKRFTSGVGEVRRAILAEDGGFVLEGLTPGEWSAIGNCRDEWIAVAPQVITIPDDGDVVVEFALQRPSH